MTRRNDQKLIIKELSHFLGWELGAPGAALDIIESLTESTDPDYRTIIAQLWDAIQDADPDPDPAIRNYIGDPFLGGIAADELARANRNATRTINPESLAAPPGAHKVTAGVSAGPAVTSGGGGLETSSLPPAPSQSPAAASRRRP